MKISKAKILVLRAALGGICCFLPASGAAQKTAGAAAVKRKELQEIERQLELKKTEIERYRAQAEQLRQDISHLAGEQSAGKMKIRLLESRIRSAEGKKLQLKSRIGALKLAEDRWQAILAREINGYGRRSFLEFSCFDSGDLWQEPFRRAAILDKVQMIRQLAGYKQDALMAESQASLQKTKLQSKTAEIIARRRQSESLYRKKAEEYAESQQKVAKTLKDVEDLKETASALTELVKMLEKKARQKAARRAPVSLPARRMHSLPWPVDGEVAVSFGRQYLPDLHTWAIHPGIDLATEPGAVVRAVAPGKVLFTGPFRSYGNVVIVDHGNAFYTIYGKLSLITAKLGGQLAPDDELGRAGTGQDAKGILYFEMRQSVEAVDPAAWLERR